MLEKIIHIPFNRTSFLTSQKNIWIFHSRKSIKRYITYTILAAVIFATDFIPDKKNDFPISMMLGGGLLFYMLLAWVGFIERRIKFFKKVKVHANRFDKVGMDCSYIFSDEGITYKDKEKLLQLSWSLFNPFLTFKDSMILTLKDQGSIMFTLSKQEIGDKNYQEIQTLLKEKIPNQNNLTH
jgi:hypothetical protein